MNKKQPLHALLLLSFCILFSACTPQVVVPPMSQMQIREMQTRNYDGKNNIATMKAVINALQDDGFIVKNADKDLGFIQATKELDIEDGSERFTSTFFNGAQARWRKNVITECSANLSGMGNSTKIRIIFQSKTLDNMGNPIDIQQVNDLKYYQEFFAKVDKSLFIEKQGL